MGMRMQSKMNFFFAVYMLGGLVVMLLSVRPAGGMSILPPLCWFLLFGVVQFFLFRCPCVFRTIVNAHSGRW